jgi:hypothetical protein
MMGTTPNVTQAQNKPSTIAVTAACSVATITTRKEVLVPVQVDMTAAVETPCDILP